VGKETQKVERCASIDKIRASIIEGGAESCRAVRAGVSARVSLIHLTKGSTRRESARRGG